MARIVRRVLRRADRTQSCRCTSYSDTQRTWQGRGQAVSLSPALLDVPAPLDVAEDEGDVLDGDLLTLLDVHLQPRSVMRQHGCQRFPSPLLSAPPCYRPSLHT